jgi:tRNA A-37 threonylcarbamoyl transferase component Bud32
MLRRFHDATARCALAGSAEVVCHGDVSPCNTVFRNGLPVALIDFDAAAPGRRVDDVAYGLFLWLDLGNEDVALADQRRRLELAASAYGIVVDRALVGEIARQVGCTAQRLRAEDRTSAAWWKAMHGWVRAHADSLVA